MAKAKSNERKIKIIEDYLKKAKKDLYRLAKLLHKPKKAKKKAKK